MKRCHEEIWRQEKKYIQTVLATVSMSDLDSDEGEAAREVQHNSRQHKKRKTGTVDIGLYPTGYMSV